MIPVKGPAETTEYEGPLEYKCVPFADLRKMLGMEGHDLIEHVSVLWQGKPHHMFVDEEGRLRGKPLNPIATRIYWNATLQRRGKADLIFDDLTANFLLKPAQLRTLPVELADAYIVGPAILWEGDME
jgi:hypothetical protein